VLLRLQAKKEKHMAMVSVERGDSQVTYVAKHLPKLPGTTVKKSFIKHREDSWQQHLQRISPFLTPGEGVWWTSVDGGYHFWDGDEDSNTHVEDDCTLLHFRQHSITDVEVRRKRCWRRVLDEKIVVPAEEVKMYDEDGISTGKMHYSRGVATYVPFAAATQELTNPHADCFSEQPTPLLSNCTTEMEVTGCIGSGEPSQTLVPPHLVLLSLLSALGVLTLLFALSALVLLLSAGSLLSVS
jgi:hypothetical protein